MAASLGLEHKNPLPRGRYWVFRIGPKDIVAFDAWLAKHRKAGNLRVVASELDQGDTTAEMTAFIVWEVLRDGVVQWEGPGLPDRSPDHVTSSQDVIQAPTLPNPGFDALAETGKKVADSVKRGTETIPVLLFALGVAYLLTQSSSKRTREDELYD